MLKKVVSDYYQQQQNVRIYYSTIFPSFNLKTWLWTLEKDMKLINMIKYKNNSYYIRKLINMK